MVTQERLNTDSASLGHLITLVAEWAQLKKKQVQLGTFRILTLIGLMCGAFAFSIFLLLAAALEIAKVINLALTQWLSFLDPLWIHLLSAVTLLLGTLILLGLLFKVLRKVL